MEIRDNDTRGEAMYFLGEQSILRDLEGDGEGKGEEEGVKEEEGEGVRGGRGYNLHSLEISPTETELESVK